MTAPSITADSTVGGFGPGFHGKLPARGDFVAHNLPRGFVKPFDAWLQAALAASRGRIGAAWERLFSASPVWRFALSADVCGALPVAGVLVPSADRVGRLYPFVIAGSLPAAMDLASVPYLASPWFARAEELALEACHSGGTDPDLLTGEMTFLGRPPAVFSGVNPVHRAQIEAMVGALPDRPSLWWTRGAHWVMPSMVACEGLPDGDRFAAFLDNSWEQWGWNDRDGAGGG
ncbi:MAG TPA: type VI secretion system-associated protein TagF [Azospirillum sp.]|nr:type VI secretion system-associated protein TagF [Azospirillum sp.]